jgi:hypothetical protein
MLRSRYRRASLPYPEKWLPGSRVRASSPGWSRTESATRTCNNRLAALKPSYYQLFPYFHFYLF